MAVRAVSSIKGDERAKALCAVRITSELDNASPRKPAGNPLVNSLNERSSWPRSIGTGVEVGVSWFKITERIACVPQAF